MVDEGEKVHEWGIRKIEGERNREKGGEGKGRGGSVCKP